MAFHEHVNLNIHSTTKLNVLKFTFARNSSTFPQVVTTGASPRLGVPHVPATVHLTLNLFQVLVWEPTLVYLPLDHPYQLARSLGLPSLNTSEIGLFGFTRWSGTFTRHGKGLRYEGGWTRVPRVRAKNEGDGINTRASTCTMTVCIHECAPFLPA
ncbi:hypothetical protein OG21DRAFT_504638 [Imleria badia]|nr:hypothetical protein OG21DRAFT_504638 [Imleria badia]